MEDLKSGRLKESLSSSEQTEAPTTDETVRPDRMAAQISSMTEEELLEAYEDFVHDVTNQIYRHCGEHTDLNVDYDCLFNCAVSGLLEAKEAFDPDEGSAFTTFAYYRVRGAAIDGVRDETWGPRSGRRVKSWKAANEQMRSHNEVAAQSQKFSTLAGSLGEIKQRVYDVYAVTFLYDEHLEARFAHEETPGDIAERSELQKTIDRAMEELPERQREVIIRYHVYDHTMTEIADDLNVTKGWVSRLNASGISALREILEEGEAF